MENNGLERVCARVEPVVKKALAEGVFSGIAAGVYRYGKGGGARVFITLGMTRNDEQGRVVTRETAFDLASLTKPFCTALAILCLVEQGELALEDRIFDILSYTTASEYREITVAQLLSHSSGLQAYIPVYRAFSPEIAEGNSAEIIRIFLEEKLAYAPGTACIYSDIGFVLLGKLIERISGLKLDQFYRSSVARAFQIEAEVVFRKILPPQKENGDIAATEFCPWRQRLLQGEVHDEHAWLMNGVAGHAGLFGTINGVLGLTEQLLHCWKGREKCGGISRQLLEQALRKKYRDQTWGLGFDTPSALGSSAGSFFSPLSAGHLGFTGTSFWIDPEKEAAVVVLSNRVYPSRWDERIKVFRPAFHNAVMEGLAS